MTNRLRSSTARGLGLQAAVAGLKPVDREKGIIRGASAMQLGEALGHKFLIDEQTLAKAAELANAHPNGVKVRYTHPGLCSDGMGKMLGRQQGFTVVGDTIRGDIHLSDAAAKSPDGDLREYVMALAEEDPESFGMSMVIEGAKNWKLPDGSEISSTDESLAREGSMGATYFARPKTATTKHPFLRPTKIHASDIVDEPAANRDGLFGPKGAAMAALAIGTNGDAAEAFDQLDAMRDRLGFSIEQAQSFLSRYFAARSTPTHAGAKPATQEVTMLTVIKLAELCEANPTHQAAIMKMAREDKTEEQILAALESIERAELAAKVDALGKKLETSEAEHNQAIAALKAAHTEEVKALGIKLARAERLSALAGHANKDPGGESHDGDKAKVPKVSRADLNAGKVDPADVLAGKVDVVDEA